LLDPVVNALQHGAMPRASHDGIEIEYATSGDPGDPALLLVNGLGDQLIDWDDELLEAFVDRGFFVIRFDNREVGRSSKTERRVDIAAAMRAVLVKATADVPFDLHDMATDAVAVLDDLGVDRAHVFGVSLGGAVAQTVAIDHPGRVASLTAVMSTTGEPSVGATRSDVLTQLMGRTPPERDAAIEQGIRFRRTIGSPDHFEEDRVRRRLSAAYDRCFNPTGAGLQLLAILASGDRAAQLAELTVPTLVMHGDRDPLIDVSGGRRIAELVPGAELVILEGMGHDLPTYFWPVVVESVTKLASRAAADEAS
jgi:pimeloyl-ACP methyl ester carboxylesterase